MTTAFYYCHVLLLHFDEYMESLRICVLGHVRTHSKRNSASVRVSSRIRKDRAAWYDHECKQYARRMYASIKSKDESFKRKMHNDYRCICRRKRAAWLESRMNISVTLERIS